MTLISAGSLERRAAGLSGHATRWGIHISSWMVHKEASVERRYGALRFIGTVYKIMGVIVAILTVLAAVVVCLGLVLGPASIAGLRDQLGADAASVLGGTMALSLGGIAGVISGFLTALLLYGVGEAVYLLIAMEENTRATALLLQRRDLYAPGEVVQPKG